MKSYNQFGFFVLFTKLKSFNKNKQIIFGLILSCLVVFSSLSADSEVSKVDLSQSDLHKAYSLNPESPRLIIAYAGELSVSNRFSEAKIILLSSFEDNENEFERLMLLGKMSLSEKDITGAINYLFRAKELNNNEQVKSALAHLASIENKIKQEIHLNRGLLTSISSM